MRATAKTYLCALLLLLGGCNSRPAQQPLDHSQVTQVSIINALMLGQYDGVVTFRELLTYGNLGLGTCDHLDGEMIVLDGKAYQAKADGTVAEVAPQSTTPFAVIAAFNKQGEFPLEKIDSLDELEGVLDKLLPNHDLFFALRVDADCESITIRSVPRQEPPYPTLAEVAKRQVVWTHQNVRGTLVGFRSPKWVHGLNVPGYHWHFLSSDHKIGGHVLDCQLRTGTVSYAVCDSWKIKLPESIASQGGDLDVDLSRDLEQVEHARASRDRK